MTILKSGSLSKLLEEMNTDKRGSEDVHVRKPVLLQIRSIIPVLEKDDLWPNRGFYLKVSDLTQATYVSLPHEQDDLILSNKLQLGQFIYVQKFEASYPVPVLRGIMPVSGGRRSCEGTTEDILPVNNLVKFLEASDTDVKDKGVISEMKIVTCGLSDSESSLESCFDGLDIRSQGKTRSSSVSKARPSEKRTKMWGPQISESSSVENETDSDSPRSTISSQISKRRSWNETELLDVKEIFDSSILRHSTRSKARSRSVCASPVRRTRDDSSDDNASLTRRRRVTSSNTKSLGSSSKKIPTGLKTKCEACPKTVCSERKVTESKIMWDAFPSNLVKLGEDLIRQRDVATLAAIEALQEACAAEKLIKCLSIYSELKSSKGDEDPKWFMDNFFELQDTLSQTRLIMQSLTNISPLRSSDSDVNSTSSVKEVLNLAVERKKKATSCIKSAISFDLSPCLCSLRPTKNTSNTTKTEKTPGHVSNSAPKLSFIVKKQRTNGSDKVHVSDWVKNSSFVEANEVSNVLQDESRKWFMSYVEKFLDEVERRTCKMDSDTKIASMMCQIKRVNDWLDVLNKECLVLDDDEVEACGRVRNKIYSVLLNHVERTAMALENMNKRACQKA